MARRSGEAIGPVATFSIVALGRTTDDLGVAVASKYFAVGSVVPWATAGVGAAAAQAWVNPRYGVEGLARLGEGNRPEETLSALLGEDRACRTASSRNDYPVVYPAGNRRASGARGRIAQHTGSETPRWAGHRAGEADGCVYAAQGNTIAGPEVLAAMTETICENFGRNGEGEHETMLRNIPFNRFGLIASAVCAIHCAPSPILFGLLQLLGGAAVNERWPEPFFVLAAGGLARDGAGARLRRSWSAVGRRAIFCSASLASSSGGGSSPRPGHC